MSYLGKVDMNDANIQRYTLTSSTASTVLFSALGWTPANIQSLRVTINGVVQQNISLTSTALDLGGALVATDELEVIGIESMGNIITPADNSVTTAKLADDAVTEPKLNTTGVAGADTFLSGTMAWTAVAGTSVTTTKTTDTTLTSSDASGYVVVPCDSSGGDVAITLPAPASAWSGSVLHLVASATPGSGNNVVIKNSGGTEIAQLNKKGDYYTVTCDSAGSSLVVIDHKQSYGGWLITTNQQGSMAHSLGTLQLFTDTTKYSIGYNYGNWWDSSADKLTVPSGWTGRIYLNLNIGLRADGYVAGSVFKDGSALKVPVIYLAAGAPQPFEWNEAVTGGEYYEPYGYNTYTSSTRYIEDGCVFQWTAERDI